MEIHDTMQMLSQHRRYHPWWKPTVDENDYRGILPCEKWTDLKKESWRSALPMQKRPISRALLTCDNVMSVT